MNKKRLSVVMAGAMLASSVAPVLAATESEVDSSRLGSLVETVYNKLTEKTFTTKTEKLADDSLAGKSVYFVKIDGKEQPQFNVVLDDAGKATLRDRLQEAFKGLSAGQKVEIYSYGFREDRDKDVVDCTITEGESSAKYTEADLRIIGKAGDYSQSDTSKDIASKLLVAGNKLVKADYRIRLANTDGSKDLKVESGYAESINIYFEADVDLNRNVSDNNVTFTKNGNGTSLNLLTIKPGAKAYDFSKYIDADGNVKTITANTKAAEVKGFPYLAEDIDSSLIETVKITGETHNYKTEDLYDGLMLTTEGHDLLSIIKEADATKGASVKFETLNGNALKVNGEGPYNTTIDLFAVNSEYGFVVKVKDAFGKETVYTVKGAEKNTEILASWLYRRLARVDVLAGDNRYETAVEIAKEQVRLVGPKYENYSKGDRVNNIVLVNGKALVDGLAAAPLAAKLTAGTGAYAKIAAPMLLTKAEELPKETKAYLLELMTNHIIGEPSSVKIHLVGGTSVLTRSLEKELEAMGFDVERYNGNNREETSLKVAEEVLKGSNANKKARFVVGAEGEADAMSIAAVAAEGKTPIIVSKKGGLSYDALKSLEDKKVTVLGGEKSVSAEDYLEIKEEAAAVRRIAGANRQATNAAIINEYYGGIEGITAKSVIVAKDGRGNNDQLVDALTAANLGVQFKAPVVLATKSLSADQLDALQLRGKSAKSLFQIGHGVQPSVIETIAARLGLLNK